MSIANRILRVVIVAVALLSPVLAWGQQTTDYSEMAQWLKTSETPPELPTGTTITMQNWRQYQAYMPLGMIKLFEGQYGWKMPADVEMNVGPNHSGNLPKTWVEATEKYGPQTQVQILANGHYVLKNYHGGTPFPDPQEPNKGWKIMANVFFAYVPAVYVKAGNNFSTFIVSDGFGNVSSSTVNVVYRWSDYITDEGFPPKENYAPGTWYTEWVMEQTPEQSRYTTSLALYYSDQEAHPFPDNYVFVPALRRSLRLSTTARCAPFLGYDLTNDDAKTNGFNGSTATYTGHYLGDRTILTLMMIDNGAAGEFPKEYDMPLGFPKPSWGQWELRDLAVDDITRIPSEASGYCYSHRVLYVDRELWDSEWNDMYDSNGKLWKFMAFFNEIGRVPQGGSRWKEITALFWDLQNTHTTIYCPHCNPNKTGAYLDLQAPKEYLNGVKYGSPSGLMQIMQ
jgi:hypothetical protein